MFYATFDPVWTADSGSHFIHYTPHEPWLHLLLDDDAFCELMKSAGAADWEINEYRGAMNRLPATFYKNILKDSLGKLFSRHEMTHWSGCTSAQFHVHQNLNKAAELTGLDARDLLIRGFQIVAVK